MHWCKGTNATNTSIQFSRFKSQTPNVAFIIVMTQVVWISWENKERGGASPYSMNRGTPLGQPCLIELSAMLATRATSTYKDFHLCSIQTKSCTRSHFTHHTCFAPICLIPECVRVYETITIQFIIFNICQQLSWLYGLSTDISRDVSPQSQSRMLSHIRDRARGGSSTSGICFKFPLA